MSRLHALGAEEVGAAVLLDDLSRETLRGKVEYELIQLDPGYGLDDEVAARAPLRRAP